MTRRKTTFGSLPVDASFFYESTTPWVKDRSRGEGLKNAYNCPEGRYIFSYFRDSVEVDVLVDETNYTTFGKLPVGSTFYVVDVTIDEDGKTYKSFPYTKVPQGSRHPNPAINRPYNATWKSDDRTVYENFKDTDEVEKA